MIRLAQVSKDYEIPHVRGREKGAERVHALRTVSMEIKKGEFVAVMGPSGCGKSTLLHVIGGLDKPSTGEVWVDEKPIHQMNERSLSLFRRGEIGLVFQFFNLLPQLTVFENVMLPLRFLGVSNSESEGRARELLESVGLGDKLANLPAEISGGEQQRVAIARALIHRPRIVLADEPTGNLDSATSNHVLSVLKELQQKHQITMLLVTHAQEVSRIAGRIVTMQDGQIV